MSFVSKLLVCILAPILQIFLAESPSNQEINEFMQEIEFMKAIGYHENILAILGCCTQQLPLCLIVEYVPNGDLQSYLRKLRKEVGFNALDNFQTIS